MSRRAALRGCCAAAPLAMLMHAPMAAMAGGISLPLCGTGGIGRITLPGLPVPARDDPHTLCAHLSCPRNEPLSKRRRAH